MEIGLLIKQLRIEKGLTQEDLAERTQLSARTIQRIENGEVDPRAYTLQMIAKALEVEFSIFTKNDAEDENLITDSDRNWLAILHLSGLFLLFFPTIIIWNRKKDEVKGMTEHFRAVISFMANWLIVVIAGLWILFKGDNPVIIMLGFIISAIQTILNAVNVLNDRPYKYWTVFKFNDKKDKTKLSLQKRK